MRSALVGAMVLVAALPGLCCRILPDVGKSEQNSYCVQVIPPCIETGCNNRAVARWLNAQGQQVYPAGPGQVWFTVPEGGDACLEVNEDEGECTYQVTSRWVKRVGTSVRGACQGGGLPGMTCGTTSVPCATLTAYTSADNCVFSEGDVEGVAVVTCGCPLGGIEPGGLELIQSSELSW